MHGAGMPFAETREGSSRSDFPRKQGEKILTDLVTLLLESEIGEPGISRVQTAGIFRILFRGQLYSTVCCQPKGEITVLPGIWDQLIPKVSPVNIPVLAMVRPSLGLSFSICQQEGWV